MNENIELRIRDCAQVNMHKSHSKLGVKHCYTKLNLGFLQRFRYINLALLCHYSILVVTALFHVLWMAVC